MTTVLGPGAVQDRWIDIFFAQKLPKVYAPMTYLPTRQLAAIEPEAAPAWEELQSMCQLAKAQISWNPRASKFRIVANGDTQHPGDVHWVKLMSQRELIGLLRDGLLRFLDREAIM